ncbi:SpaA isopeptide-forming pilin-related protein [Lutibacter sp. B1]|uniref:SpaA isopeptide-forming pilin-related protein n=1 Tax=Lutibacter sp. B1 TaxID=2725996 RepID=UPI001456F45F|nr:hypothetical protein [Lutibacter sp. B1]NLP59190.1 hypothetical protein [Lutibacter sp. B1]
MKKALKYIYFLFIIFQGCAKDMPHDDFDVLRLSNEAENSIELHPIKNINSTDSISFGLIELGEVTNEGKKKFTVSQIELKSDSIYIGNNELNKMDMVLTKKYDTLLNIINAVATRVVDIKEKNNKTKIIGFSPVKNTNALPEVKKATLISSKSNYGELKLVSQNENFNTDGTKQDIMNNEEVVIPTVILDEVLIKATSKKANSSNLMIKNKDSVKVTSIVLKSEQQKTNSTRSESSTDSIKIINTENSNKVLLNVLEKNKLKVKENSVYNFNLKVLSKNKRYEVNKRHTLLVEVENESAETSFVKLDVLFPEGWSIISVSTINSFKKNEKKIAYISFYIPSNTKPGKIPATIEIKDVYSKTIQSVEVMFNVAENYDLDVYNIYTPQNLRAGELIRTAYAIKNNGNIEQKINLKSKNIIDGENILNIAPDSTIIVNLTQKTDAKTYYFRSIGTGLEVYSNTSGETYRSYNSVEVFPSKIKQKDAFFRYPVRASLYYNSYTNKKDHFSTMSAEVSGDGYLDLDKNHYLNFIIRGPKQENLKRFGVADQYSLIYKYKDETILYLGDHSYEIDRLGFNSRYGMGFRLIQNVKNWTLSAFYSKPRLYKFNSEPIYGVKADYYVTDSLSTGVSLTRSKGFSQFTNQNINENPNEEGQILTFNVDYRNRNTLIKGESSVSLTNENIDVANYINLTQKFKNLTYNGSLTIAGKNYFGTLTNSFQYTNNLNYAVNKWNFGLGQSLYKVNQRLDPLFYAAEPYFENYYGYVGYRFNQYHKVNFRFDRREREDKLEPKNYHYKEYGLNYSYSYSSNTFFANFNGRIAKTRNLLSDFADYNNTYAHNLSMSYRFSNSLRLRGNINHNYSNRYGSSNTNLNYVRYSAGVNYNFSNNLRLNTTYNSGFSPEDTYLKRDYISANLMAKLNKNHLFEVRSNYFETPGTVNKKELLVYGKYTYSFGVPIKKIAEQGGIDGYVFSLDKTIDIKKIKIIAEGKTVLTDKNGKFELNNLSLGKNYILIDESTLPIDVVASTKIPFEVKIEEGNKVQLDIELVRSTRIYGIIDLGNNQLNKYNLQGYIKLENDNFTYYTESNSKGEFQFKKIVPGTYKLTLIRLRENNKLFDIENNVQVIAKAGEKSDVKVNVKIKTRKIKFNNKNFKVGQ